MTRVEYGGTSALVLERCTITTISSIDDVHITFNTALVVDTKCLPTYLCMLQRYPATRASAGNNGNAGRRMECT